MHNLEIGSCGTMGKRTPLCLVCPNCDHSHSPVISFSCPLAVALTHGPVDLPLNTQLLRRTSREASVVEVLALAQREENGSALICLPSCETTKSSEIICVVFAMIAVDRKIPR